MARLELQDVRKSFGTVDVIMGADLDIQHGEFCVFVGPSGCGKSTLLRMIAGLENVSSGAINIDGEQVNDIAAADRGLAMVFQSYALYPHMTVKQNLSFGLENLKAPRTEIETKVSEVAKMLQIDELLERRPKDLSGGQRQRVAIGRAVVREPRIFLFDEPLSNLDAELRVSMRGEIARLHRRLGNTMIYVTHDQVEAMTMADKIAVLRDGNVEQFGVPLELYNHPANLFVAGFIGSPKMNFLDGRLVRNGADDGMLTLPSGEAIAIDLGTFTVSEDIPATLGVRPGDLHVTDSSQADLQVNVNDVEQLGGESYLYVSIGDGLALTVHVTGQTEIRPGDDVPLKIDRAAIHLFDTRSEMNLQNTAVSARS